MKHQINIMLAAASLIVAGDAFAQTEMQTPSVQAGHGQSQARQSRDTDRCNMQARKQTGVDPIAIAANATPLQPGKGITSVPIEAPSTAMGASAAGATAAGTGDMTAGNSASGQMNNAGSAQMETGTGQTANASSGQMSNANNGQMAGSSSTAQTGTATSNSDWATGRTASGNAAMAGSAPSSNMAGASSAGTSASGSSASGSMGSSGNTVAVADSADAYNQAFSKCMSSHGYSVSQ